MTAAAAAAAAREGEMGMRARKECSLSGKRNIMPRPTAASTVKLMASGAVFHHRPARPLVPPLCSISLLQPVDVQ